MSRFIIVKFLLLLFLFESNAQIYYPITIELGNSKVVDNFNLHLKCEHNYLNHFTYDDCNPITHHYTSDSTVILFMDYLDTMQVIKMFEIPNPTNNIDSSYCGIWTMDNLDDLSNYNNNLTHVGIPNQQQGKINSAFKLNQSSNYYLFSAYDACFDKGDGFTMSFWVKWQNENELQGNHNYLSGLVSRTGVFSFGVSPDYSKIIYSYYNSWNPLSIINQVLCTPISPPNCDNFISGDDTWHNIVITRSSSDTVAKQSNGSYIGSQNFKIYFDTDDKIIYDVWGLDTLNTNNTTLKIGIYDYYYIGNFPTYGVNQLLSNMYIDEFYYYNYRRDSDWVIAQFNNQNSLDSFITIGNPVNDTKCFNILDFEPFGEPEHELPKDNPKPLNCYDLLGRELDCSNLPKRQVIIQLLEYNIYRKIIVQ